MTLGGVVDVTSKGIDRVVSLVVRVAAPPVIGATLGLDGPWCVRGWVIAMSLFDNFCNFTFDSVLPTLGCLDRLPCSRRR